MTLHNIYCINRDIAEISPSLLLTIILIKNIQLRVAGQAFEVSVKKRLVIAKTASSSRNVAFKSDKIMDALFQGQSAEQTPQPFVDADFEGLTSNAEVYIFNQDDSQE